MLLEWWKLLRYRFFLYREPSGTAGALEEVSLRRNALFRNYGTRMFLLFCRLFSFFSFFFMVKVLDVRIPPNLGAFLSSFIRSPVSKQPTSNVSAVRSSPPPRCCSSRYDNYPYPLSTVYSTVIFDNSVFYFIFFLNLFECLVFFPIPFISGWRNNPTVVQSVFV